MDMCVYKMVNRCTSATVKFNTGVEYEMSKGALPWQGVRETSEGWSPLSGTHTT